MADGQTTEPAGARALRWSALGGAAAWAVMLLLPAAPAGPLDRVLLLAVLVVTPLALALIATPLPAEQTVARSVALLHPLAAAAAVAALWLEQGLESTALATPWLAVTLLVFVRGLVRATRLRRDGLASEELLRAVALLALPVGGAWLVALRLGMSPFGRDPLAVATAAAHFHYVALAAPVLVATTASRLRSQTRWRRVVTRVAATGLVAGIVLAGLGDTGSPNARIVGAAVLAAGVLAGALLLGRAAVEAHHWLPRVLLGVAGLSPWLAIPLAVVRVGAEIAGAHVAIVDLGTMVRLHGGAHAYGFALCGLLAWTWPGNLPAPSAV